MWGAVGPVCGRSTRASTLACPNQLCACALRCSPVGVFLPEAVAPFGVGYRIRRRSTSRRRGRTRRRRSYRRRSLRPVSGLSTRGRAPPGGACSLRRRFSHPWALAPLGARSPLHSVASVGAPSLSSRSRGRSLPSAFAAFAPVGVGVGACSLWRRFSHPSVLAPVSARTRRRAPPVGARTRQRSTRACALAPVGARSSRGRSLPSAFAAFAPVGARTRVRSDEMSL